LLFRPILSTSSEKRLASQGSAKDRVLHCLLTEYRDTRCWSGLRDADERHDVLSLDMGPLAALKEFARRPEMSALRLRNFEV